MISKNKLIKGNKYYKSIYKSVHELFISGYNNLLLTKVSDIRIGDIILMIDYGYRIRIVNNLRVTGVDNKSGPVLVYTVDTKLRELGCYHYFNKYYEVFVI